MFPTPDSVFYRALIHSGDANRFGAFLKKCSEGGPVIVGAIGGSITEGAAASTEADRYANVFCSLLSRHFPKARIRLVNAGIGASNSLFGAFRIKKDLLIHKPDLILVDYAVNDNTNPDMAPAYEGLLRQCLGATRAVLTVAMVNDQGVNRQDVHLPIAKQYGLPLISIRDALWPAMESGLMTWKDYSPDTVHPNDAGHAWIAGLLFHYLNTLPTPPVAENITPLRPPLSSESALYEQGGIVDASGMNLVELTGWSKGPHKAGYTGLQSQEPGSTFSLKLSGTYLAIGYQQFRGDFGIASVTVDGGTPMELNAHFVPERPVAWAGGHTVLQILGKNLSPGEHLVTVKLLDKKHPESTGHRFDVGYFLTSSTGFRS